VPVAAAGQIILRALLRQRRERLAIPPTPHRPELLGASSAGKQEGDTQEKRPS